jgi:hypothetical protein
MDSDEMSVNPDDVFVDPVSVGTDSTKTPPPDGSPEATPDASVSPPDPSQDASVSPMSSGGLGTEALRGGGTITPVGMGSTQNNCNTLIPYLGAGRCSGVTEGWQQGVLAQITAACGNINIGRIAMCMRTQCAMNNNNLSDYLNCIRRYSDNFLRGTDLGCGSCNSMVPATCNVDAGTYDGCPWCRHFAIFLYQLISQGNLPDGLGACTIRPIICSNMAGGKKSHAIVELHCGNTYYILDGFLQTSCSYAAADWVAD